MPGKRRVAVIAGAGPAGLTAAWELFARTDILPVVIETTDANGGIAQTYTYKGNRIDLGGHRFFSKSERVMNWWFSILPKQGAPALGNATHKHDVEYATDVIVRPLVPGGNGSAEVKETKRAAPDPAKEALAAAAALVITSGYERKISRSLGETLGFTVETWTVRGHEVFRLD